jgi:RNA polymerase primary sigma factor
MIEDEHSISPEANIISNDNKNIILSVLNTLSDQEKDVIILRFGLSGNRPHTLDEIGELYDVTKERIRQIEAKALRKLRQPSRANILKQAI